MRLFSSLFRLVFDGFVKPLQALAQFLGPRGYSSLASSLPIGNEDDNGESSKPASRTTPPLRCSRISMRFDSSGSSFPPESWA
ncbi:hypothetical protein RchiOBHm_Chr2g0143491 [Rosa chinensis]|uniref:Uncharacterized protein n=1 Tax=Rosa chinensis TaxID=74649 RepID=A0A2P6RY41_ROSCH|nr:hypothetical protein RchiOBHm_Chr2g0143491 [Rosa chinensis]